MLILPQANNPAIPAQTNLLNDGISGMSKGKFVVRVTYDWFDFVILKVDRTSLHIHFETHSRGDDGQNDENLDHHCGWLITLVKKFVCPPGLAWL